MINYTPQELEALKIIEATEPTTLTGYVPQYEPMRNESDMKRVWAYIVHKGEVTKYYAALERSFTLLSEFSPHCLMSVEQAQQIMKNELKDPRYELKKVRLTAI